AAPRRAARRLWPANRHGTKSSSVVSLGRNVTVSWTKFRTAMRISNPSGGDRTGTYYRGPRQGREAVRSNVDGPAVEKWRSRHGTHPDRSARHEGPAAALHPWLARGQHHLRGGPVALRQRRQSRGQGRHQGANTAHLRADQDDR